MIREYIRGSYAGMRAEDVVVIDTNADPSVCPTNDAIARKQCEEEARLKQEVQNILQGYGPIRIAAYIEMQESETTETTAGTPTIVRQSQPSPPVVNQSERDRSLLNEIIEAVTHVSSNRATRLNERDSDAQQPTTAKVAVRKVSHDKAMLKSVRLSIGIPESYYLKVWQLSFLRNHPGKSIQDIPALGPAELTTMQQQTKANITTAVTPALMSRVLGPDFRGDESAATVDIWSFPDLTAEPTPEPAQVATGITWVSQSWRQIAAGLLGCLMVWILFAALRSGGNKNAAGQPSEKSRQTDTYATETANAEIIGELSSLVDQHPDLAADAIRSWVGEAA